MNNDRIRLLDHTADIRVRVQADSINHLFELGPEIIYRVIGSPISGMEQKGEYKISLTADGYEDLFHDWLSEILYWIQVRKIIFENASFDVLTKQRLNVRVKGKELDPEKSTFHTEIKAVTYHELSIREEENNVIANIVLDV